MLDHGLQGFLIFDFRFLIEEFVRKGLIVSREKPEVLVGVRKC